MSLVERTDGGGARKVAMFHTICTNVANSSINSDKKRLELDSHADTNVLVKGYLVVHAFDRLVNVTRYDTEGGSECFLECNMCL